MFLLLLQFYAQHFCLTGLMYLCCTAVGPGIGRNDDLDLKLSLMSGDCLLLDPIV